MRLNESPLNRRDAMGTARQSRNRKGCNPLASRYLGNSSQLANNFDYCSAESNQPRPVESKPVKSDCFGPPLPCPFLCVHRVAAVPWHSPRLHRNGLVVPVTNPVTYPEPAQRGFPSPLRNGFKGALGKLPGRLWGPISWLSAGSRASGWPQGGLGVPTGWLPESLGWLQGGRKLLTRSRYRAQNRTL
jgi:hypothetical protein